jgi:hypothetical protein
VVDAVKQWQFTPAQRNGAPVATKVILPVRVVETPKTSMLVAGTDPGWHKNRNQQGRPRQRGRPFLFRGLRGARYGPPAERFPAPPESILADSASLVLLERLFPEDDTLHDEPPKHALSAVIQWFDADYAPGGAEAMRNEPDKVTGCAASRSSSCTSAASASSGRAPALRGLDRRRPLLRQDGRGDRRLPPLFLAQDLQHVAADAVRPRALRGDHGAARAALVGLPPPPPPPAFRRGRGRHSPHVHGFWWSHIGWITSRRNFPTDYSKVRDLDRYPELVFLNRFDAIVPFAFALSIFGLGAFLAGHAPGLHTSGWQMLVWGFFISTTALFHGTSCINSMAHLMGRRRYKTEDDSRNSFILAIITLGEGWHNNHHRYQSATRNGFFWWEVDITYYLLKGLSWTGLIWGLKAVPASVLAEGEQRTTTSPSPPRRRRSTFTRSIRRSRGSSPRPPPSPSRR